MDINNLIFLHIPKAGGTTLNSILGNQYGRRNRIFINGIQDGIDKVQNIKVNEFKRTTVFTGHMAFGLHEYLPGRSKYITYIRSPVDRVISIYKYIHRNPEHPLHNKFIDENISLQTFVTSEFDRDTENGQTKLIAGIKANGHEKGLLEIALDNINKYFVYVGIMEMFDESLLLMARYLHWSNYVYFKQNVSNSKYGTFQVDNSVIQLIKEKNLLDLELYSIFKKKLMNDCKTEGKTFYKDLTHFQKCNTLFQILMYCPYKIFQKIRVIKK